MVFDVEYIVADARSLHGKKKGLIEFLRPLHEKNEIIRKRYFNYSNIPYYKSIGSLNTSETSEKTIFDARNAVKFPIFNHTKIYSTGDFVADIKLKKKIRRYFSTESFGAVNRLRIGFEFDLHINNFTDKNAISKLLSCIFNINIVDSKNKSYNLKQLDSWFLNIVQKSVFKHSWLEKRIKFFRINKSSSLVKSIGIIASVEYTEDEINKLPTGTKEIFENEFFLIHSYIFDPSCNNFHFNNGETEIKEKPKIEIYFILNKDVNCKSAQKIKSKLFLVKSNYLCLDFIINKINLSTKKQKEYINRMEEVEKEINHDSTLFLLSPKVLGSQENIARIKKRIIELRKIDDFINLPKNNN